MVGLSGQGAEGTMGVTLGCSSEVSRPAFTCPILTGLHHRPERLRAPEGLWVARDGGIMGGFPEEAGLGTWTPQPHAGPTPLAPCLPPGNRQGPQWVLPILFLDFPCLYCLLLGSVPVTCLC